METTQNVRELVRRKQNGLVFLVYLVSILLVIGIQIAVDRPLERILLSVGFGAVAVGAIGLLHFRKKGTQIIPYIALVSVSSLVLTIMVTSDNYTNSLFTLLILMISALYMTKIILYLGMGIGLSLMLGYFYFKGEAMMETLNIGLPDFIMCGLVYVLISILLIAQHGINKFLTGTIENKTLQTSAFLDQERERKQYLKDNTNLLSVHMEEIRDNSEDTMHAFKTMSTSLQEMSAGMENQGLTISSIIQAVEDTSEQINKVSASIMLLNQKANEANDSSVQGEEIVEHLINIIDQFQKSMSVMSKEVEELSSKINEITGFNQSIQEIASQTNLLALNASIEAARAGDSGRGFAVVADEVRKLSELTTETATKIKENLSSVSISTKNTLNQMADNGQQMDKSVQMTKETKNAFNQIKEYVAVFNQEVASANQLIGGISKSSSRIKDEVNGFASVVEQATATIQEISATVNKKSDQYAQQLNRIQESHNQIRDIVNIYNSEEKGLIDKRLSMLKNSR